MADDPSGFERLEARASARADRWAGDLAGKPKRTVAKVLGILVTILVVLAVGSWATSWDGEARRITSPTNVSAQYTAVIGGWQAMQAAAANTCDAKTSAPSVNDPTLVESPTLAYASRYRSIAADYNRRRANLFEAKLVGPKGYPSTAPTLKIMQAEVC